MRQLIAKALPWIYLAASITVAAAQDSERIGIAVSVQTSPHVNTNDLRAFVNAVPSDWLTPAGAVPRYEVRFTPVELIIEECDYTVRLINTATVTRIRVDVGVTIVDLGKRVLVGVRDFTGVEPPACQGREAFETSVGGSPINKIYVGDPNDTDFGVWLSGIVESLAGVTEIEPGVNAGANEQSLLPVTSHVLDWGLGQRWSSAAVYSDYSPDGRTIVTTGADQMMRIWDARTGRELYQTERTRGDVVFSPDGSKIAVLVTTGNNILITDSIGIPLNTIEYQLPISNFRFSPDSRTMAVTARDSDAPGWIQDIETAEILTEFTGFQNGPWTANYSPDGRYIVTFRKAEGVNNFVIEVWDVATGLITLQTSEFDHNPGEPSFSPDGRSILAGGFDMVRIWDAQSGHLIREIEVPFLKNGRGVLPIFSPGGRFIATKGGDWTIRIFDVSTGEQVRLFTGHTGHILSITYRFDGRAILTSGSDGTVRIWDVSDLAVVDTSSLTNTLVMPNAVDAMLPKCDGVVTSNSRSVNMRVGPSTTSEIVYAVPVGDTVQIAAHSGGWYSVVHSEAEGWMFGQLLSLVGLGCNDLPEG